jgi:DNA primase
VVVPELRGGQPIWLIGRPLDEQQARVKYLALPGERPVLGFERAAGRREVFLIEGVFDVRFVPSKLVSFSCQGMRG